MRISEKISEKMIATLTKKKIEIGKYQGSWDCIQSLTASHVNRAIAYLDKHPEENRYTSWTIVKDRKKYGPLALIKAAIYISGYEPPATLKTYQSARHLKRLGFTVKVVRD